MRIIKISKCGKGCGHGKDFGKPKGHLDTQLFPECKGTKYDRDVAKKHKAKNKTKKASFNLSDIVFPVCKTCILKKK